MRPSISARRSWSIRPRESFRRCASLLDLAFISPSSTDAAASVASLEATSVPPPKRAETAFLVRENATGATTIAGIAWFRDSRATVEEPPDQQLGVVTENGMSVALVFSSKQGEGPSGPLRQQEA